MPAWLMAIFAKMAAAGKAVQGSQLGQTLGAAQQGGALGALSQLGTQGGGPAQAPPGIPGLQGGPPITQIPGQQGISARLPQSSLMQGVQQPGRLEQFGRGAMDFLGNISSGGNVFTGAKAVGKGRENRQFNRYLDKRIGETPQGPAQDRLIGLRYGRGIPGGRPAVPSVRAVKQGDGRVRDMQYNPAEDKWNIPVGEEYSRSTRSGEATGTQKAKRRTVQAGRKRMLAMDRSELRKFEKNHPGDFREAKASYLGESREDYQVFLDQLNEIMALPRAPQKAAAGKGPADYWNDLADLFSGSEQEEIDRVTNRYRPTAP